MRTAERSILLRYFNKWQKMIFCARINWICHFVGCISHPMHAILLLIWNTNYPLPGHFQISGRDGSGNWKKDRVGSGTGIPSDPAPGPNRVNDDQCVKNPEIHIHTSSKRIGQGYVQCFSMVIGHGPLVQRCDGFDGSLTSTRQWSDWGPIKIV